MTTFSRASFFKLALLVLALNAANCGSLKIEKAIKVPHKAKSSDNLDSELIVEKKLRKNSQHVSFEEAQEEDPFSIKQKLHPIKSSKFLLDQTFDTKAYSNQNLTRNIHHSNKAKSQPPATEQDDFLKHQGHHNITYEGDANNYIGNPDYTVRSQKVEVDKNKIEHVTLFVTPRMESISQFHSVAIMTCTAFIILIALEFKNWVQKFFQDEILKSLNTILRDNILLICVVLEVKYLHYFNQLDFLTPYMHIEGVCLGLLLFALVWTVYGLFIVVITHFYVNHWKTYEENFPNREKIFREFEYLYLEPNRNKNQQKEFEKKKLELEYFLLRQEFISPSFLPVVGEDFLRDDFDFALYLGGCMAKVSSQSFRYAFTTLLSFLLAAGFYIILSSFWHSKKEIILLVIPSVILIIMTEIKIKLDRIYLQIVNAVNIPYDVNFTQFESVRQPLINLGRINLPRYLQGEPPAADNFRPMVQGLAVPNRHELLFWLGNPRIIMTLLNCLLVSQIMWVTWFWLVGYTKMENYLYIILALGAWLAVFANLIFLTPKILRNYCIVTNTQMQKDKSMVRFVNEKAMSKRSFLMNSLYRFLKAMGRDLRNQKDYKYPSNAQAVEQIEARLISENFAILSKGDAKAQSIRLAQIDKFANLCGRTLSKEEAVHLALAVSHVRPNQDEIYLADIIQHIKTLRTEVGQDPAELSQEILSALLKRDKMTPLADFKKLLSLGNMIDSKLTDRIMKEIRYLPLKNAEISIGMIATMIRDSIQEFPR